MLATIESFCLALPDADGCDVRVRARVRARARARVSVSVRVRVSYAHSSVLVPAYCTHGLRLPASSVPYVPRTV